MDLVSGQHARLKRRRERIDRRSRGRDVDRLDPECAVREGETHVDSVRDDDLFLWREIAEWRAATVYFLLESDEAKGPSEFVVAARPSSGMLTVATAIGAATIDDAALTRPVRVRRTGVRESRVRRSWHAPEARR
jgi:hypothetical protein